MKILEYIESKKELYDLLMQFIDNKDEIVEDYLFQDFIDTLEKQKILHDQEELSMLLHLISKLSKSHCRYFNFFEKIGKIFTEIKDNIQKNFSNFEIFNFFKKDKRILLFLFENDMISVDKSIYNFILNENSAKCSFFCHFFYIEIEKFKKEKLFELDESIVNNFEEKRQKGENDSYICSLIRDDLINEFIFYINRINLPLSSKIEDSIFETNSFLLKNKGQTTLIEYAAFFGSIQIFQYLRLNNVELKPSLWLYAIHSNNAELIHLLESIGIKPKDETYEECLQESIKCHHNDLCEYIKINLINHENDDLIFNKNIHSYSFHYHNYLYFPDDLNDKIFFFYSCQFNYIVLVKLLLENKDININETIRIIQKKNYFFFMKFDKKNFF